MFAPATQEVILESLRALGEEIHFLATKNLFWTSLPPEFEHFQKSEKLMLVTSELGECEEAIRKPGPSDKIPEFSGEEEEWADAIIRLLDYGHHYNLRYGAILAKMAFNATRPPKHGKKF